MKWAPIPWSSEIEELVKEGLKIEHQRYETQNSENFNNNPMPLAIPERNLKFQSSISKSCLQESL